MDNHPIPQDVTGFQFKLFGNLTVKQFAYLAAPIITSFILYYIPIFILIKIFLIIILLIFGFGYTFLPIEGRPADVMTIHLFKALFSPNQYVYHKIGRVFAIQALADVKQAPPTVAKTPKNYEEKGQYKEQQLHAFLTTIHEQPKNALDQKELAFLQSVLAPIPQAVPLPTPSYIKQVPQPQPMASLPNGQIGTQVPAPAQNSFQTASVPAPSPQISQQNEEKVLDEKVLEIKGELEQAKIDETMQAATDKAQIAHQKTLGLESQLQQIMQQKQQVEQELQQLKQQSIQQTPPLSVPQQAAPQIQPAVLPNQQYEPQQTQETVQDIQHVRKVSPAMATSVGLPSIPDSPNLITGIVKDPRGNVLQNILVEIKDADGNPVRAFKTNPLGQFASATPLMSGVYTIQFEDPKKQQQFDTIEITTKGEVIMPIEVISHDAREELRKALFN